MSIRLLVTISLINSAIMILICFLGFIFAAGGYQLAGHVLDYIFYATGYIAVLSFFMIMCKKDNKWK